MKKQIVETIVDSINRFLKFFSVLFIAVMSILVLINVISRYFFSYSLTFSAELSRYFMVWATLLGAAILVNRDEHLSVNILEMYVGGLARKILKSIQAIGASILFVVQIYYGFMLVYLTSGQVAASVRFLSMNMVYAILPISGIFMLIGLILKVYLIWERKEE